MSANVPVYQLAALAETEEKPAAVFFLGPNSPAPHLPIDRPYRSNYYKIGLVLRGSARLQVDLETYELGPHSLMVLSPYVIKQWPYLAADCDAPSIFFTSSLVFYADKLCITPEHLAETVRAATGKRTVAWLAEAVVLETQMLLQNPALTIGQIADTLPFAD